MTFFIQGLFTTNSNAARDTILTRWHTMLGLAHHKLPWYRDRLRAELLEQRQATGYIARLSETSDVFFSISRAHHDGFPLCSLPAFTASRHGLVYTYMLAKYTSRWAFYRTAAFLCNVPHHREVREAVNPGRDHKLVSVARRNGIDPERFARVGKGLRGCGLFYHEARTKRGVYKIRWGRGRWEGRFIFC